MAHGGRFTGLDVSRGSFQRTKDKRYDCACALPSVVSSVGERYNVNIGEVDDSECGMKRNILHLLCLQPMSHSELVKLLPEDVCLQHSVYCLCSSLMHILFKKCESFLGRLLRVNLITCV